MLRNKASLFTKQKHIDIYRKSDKNRKKPTHFKQIRISKPHSIS